MRLRELVWVVILSWAEATTATSQTIGSWMFGISGSRDPRILQTLVKLEFSSPTSTLLSVPSSGG